MDDAAVDEEFLRRRPVFSSTTSSKTGDDGRVLGWLELLSDAVSQSSLLYGRNFPPWIGGRKLVHLPSIRPI